MATNDLTVASGYEAVAYQGYNFVVAEKVVSAATLTNKAATDTIDVLDIPANSFVIVAGVEVITADTTGSSPTLSLGDSSSATQFLSASSNPKASAGTVVASAATTWKFYKTTSPLRVTINTAALTNAVFRVFAYIVRDTGNTAVEV